MSEAIDEATAMLAALREPAGVDMGILRTVAGTDADWLAVTASRDNPSETIGEVWGGKPTAICCAACGSTSVCSDAVARWSGSEWELSSVFDDCTCDACGYEGHGFHEVSLSDLRAWREGRGFDADALEQDERI